MLRHALLPLFAACLSAGEAATADLTALIPGLWRGFRNDGKVTWHYRIELKSQGKGYTGQATAWKWCREETALAVIAGRSSKPGVDAQVFVESLSGQLQGDQLRLVGGTIKGVPSAGLKPDLLELTVHASGVATSFTKKDERNSQLAAFCTEAVWKAPADPLTRVGKVEQVECLGTPFHYSIYLPKGYTPDKPAPLCLLSSPSGKGQPASRTVADERGWVMVGLTEAMNGPWNPIVQNRDAVLLDLHRRVAIDWSRVIFTGLSGGAAASRVSAANHPDGLAGLLLAVGPSAPAPWPDTSVPIFFITGATDMNKGRVESDAQAQKSAKRPVELLVHDGGHEWGGPANIDKGLLWLIDHAPGGAAGGKPDRP